MTANFPGTYEVRIQYLTDEPAEIAGHELRLSCEMSIAADPGDPFTDWIPVQKDGSAVTTLKTHVDNFLALVQPAHSTATDYIIAELWEYAPASFDAVFRSAYTLGLSGTGGATVPYSQTIITFRSTLGGIGKLDLRGAVFGAAARLSFPTANTTINALAAALVAGSSIWHARDQGYFIAPLFTLIGQNERAWAKVNR